MSSYCSPFNSLKHRCTANECHGVGSQQSIPSWYAGQKLSDTLPCLARQSSLALPFSNTLSAPSKVCRSSSLKFYFYCLFLLILIFGLFFGTLHNHTHLRIDSSMLTAQVFCVRLTGAETAYLFLLSENVTMIRLFVRGLCSNLSNDNALRANMGRL